MGDKTSCGVYDDVGRCPSNVGFDKFLAVCGCNRATDDVSVNKFVVPGFNETFEVDDFGGLMMDPLPLGRKKFFLLSLRDSLIGLEDGVRGVVLFICFNGAMVARRIAVLAVHYLL